MTENYLHYLWKYKRFTSNQFQTAENKIVEVLHFGSYNENESGPDFFNGKIKIDGLVLAGNIELHVKSSDWNFHGHDIDNAYSNVILHVVYEYDQPILINGYEIPTIELKDLIDQHHFRWFNQLKMSTTKIACEKMIHDVDSIYFEQMVERAVHQRLHRKIKDINLELTQGEALYRLLAKAFGSKVNSASFEELARQLPYDRYIRLNKVEKQVYVQLSSGLLEIDTKISVHAKWLKDFKQQRVGCMNSTSWKRKGARSITNPIDRINLMCAYFEKIDFEWFVHANEIDMVFEYFNHTFKQCRISSMKWTQFVEDQVRINAIAPFFYWMAEKYQEEKYASIAINILEQTKAEVNAITRLWSPLSKSPKNAYDSQGYLEIYNEFCFYKKCLSCEVGSKLLKA